MLPKIKPFLAPALLLLFLLAACNSKAPSSGDELSALIKKRDQLNDQIAQLKAQTGGDSTTVGRTIPVSIEKLQPQVFRDYIDIQGRVDADKNVTVTAQSPGVVTRIFVKTGQQVTAGQTLAQLDDNVVRQQLAQLQNQLDYAKNIYDRRKNLWDQNIGTKVELLTAQNNYENVTKQINVVESQLDNYRITSPISGVVDDVIIKIGQAASPGVPTFRVVNMQDLKVVGTIGESYVANVKQGDAVELIFPDLKDTLHTHLSYVSHVIDPTSRGFNIEVKLPQNRNFHPNMLTIIKVVRYENSKALVVPVSVIQTDSKGNYVYTVEQNKAVKKPVKVANVYGGRAEITEGLEPGSTIITAGYREVNAGSAVVIK